MQVTNRTRPSVSDLATWLECPTHRRLMFQSKEYRAEVVKELVRRGMPKSCIVLRSSRGSRLHPEYVADYEGQLETGFGNTQYQTYWKSLYQIEIMS